MAGSNCFISFQCFTRTMDDGAVEVNAFLAHLYFKNNSTSRVQDRDSLTRLPSIWLMTREIASRRKTCTKWCSEANRHPVSGRGSPLTRA